MGITKYTEWKIPVGDLQPKEGDLFVVEEVSGDTYADEDGTEVHFVTLRKFRVETLDVAAINAAFETASETARDWSGYGPE